MSAGAVVDNDLDSALVVLDDRLIVLDRVASLGAAVGAAEEVVIEERENILGEVGCLERDRGEALCLLKRSTNPLRYTTRSTRAMTDPD